MMIEYAASAHVGLIVLTLLIYSPALTTMNHHPSNGMSHYSHSQQFLLPQSQPRTQYPYQHTSHSSTLSIDPSFVNTTSSHFQQSPPPPLPRPSSHQYAASPPPVTLAPYVLHSPPSHNVHPTSGIPPSSFYASQETPTSSQPLPPPQPTGPTPEQLRERFLTGLRPLLKSDSFTGAGAVTKLTNYISNYGISKVDIPTRLEVLSKIRDNAPNHYFRAWAENGAAMTITKKWLLESGSAEPDTDESAATMPLLHVSYATRLHL